MEGARLFACWLFFAACHRWLLEISPGKNWLIKSRTIIEPMWWKSQLLLIPQRQKMVTRCALQSLPVKRFSTKQGKLVLAIKIRLSLLCQMAAREWPFFFFFNFYFIWLHQVLFVECWICDFCCSRQTLSCGKWELVP